MLLTLLGYRWTESPRVRCAEVHGGGAGPDRVLPVAEEQEQDRGVQRGDESTCSHVQRGARGNVAAAEVGAHGHELLLLRYLLRHAKLHPVTSCKR